MSEFGQQWDQRNANLIAHGYSEVFTSGDLFATYMTSCRTCGATVALTPKVEGETHPLDLHAAWHRWTFTRPGTGGIEKTDDPVR